MIIMRSHEVTITYIVDQIVAINGESVAGCDHREVGRMVQRSPPLTQITVIHHHHGNDYLCLVMVKIHSLRCRTTFTTNVL